MGLRGRHPQSLAVLQVVSLQGLDSGELVRFPRGPPGPELPCQEGLDDNLLSQPHFTDEKTEAESVEAFCPEITSDLRYELGHNRETAGVAPTRLQ